MPLNSTAAFGTWESDCGNSRGNAFSFRKPQAQGVLLEVSNEAQQTSSAPGLDLVSQMNVERHAGVPIQVPPLALEQPGREE